MKGWRLSRVPLVEADCQDLGVTFGRTRSFYWLSDLRQQLLQQLGDGRVVWGGALWDGAGALLLPQQQVTEKAGDVLGAQSVVEDGATDRLLQHAEQHQLLVYLLEEEEKEERQKEENEEEYE